MKKRVREASKIFRGDRITAGIFVIVIVLFFFAVLFVKTPDLLEKENRKAASRPAFSLDAFLSGTLSEELEACHEDHFPLRESWIDFKCFIDEAVFRKTEEGGILLGKDGWMFDSGLSGQSEKNAQMMRNAESVRTFADTCGVPVTLMVVPSSTAIYRSKVPRGTPTVPEDREMDRLTRAVGDRVRVLDLRSTFRREAAKSDKERAGASEDLYYRTDHHWTSRGAYLAYRKFIGSHAGRTPYPWIREKAREVPGFTGTHYQKTRLWNVRKDTIRWYDDGCRMTIWNVRGDADFTARRSGPTVNRKKFRTFDKYSAFLDGNNGYTTIRGKGSGSLLVVKDSYANCFVPYLTKNYRRIGVLDYRGYSYGLRKLIKQEKYQEVLILYSFDGFRRDKKLPYLVR
ncbi:MAG: DHHW family protein [Anaerovoracaceae bacterium]|jgi:hypothetical protein